MSISFAHRHVLEDRISGFHTTENPDHLSVIRGQTIITVLAHLDRQEDVELALNLLDDVSLRSCGPSEWLVVSNSMTPDVLLEDLRGIPGCSAFDHSDGRVLMRIAGPNARRVLAKCLAIDLHPAVFSIGTSANLLVAHVSGNLARTGADTFEIILPRSSATWVFDELLEMGREFAMTAGFGEG